jgi:hypothetical protein
MTNLAVLLLCLQAHETHKRSIFIDLFTNSAALGDIAARPRVDLQNARAITSATCGCPTLHFRGAHVFVLSSGPTAAVTHTPLAAPTFCSRTKLNQ